MREIPPLYEAFLQEMGEIGRPVEKRFTISVQRGRKKLEHSMPLPVTVTLSCKHASRKSREGKELPQRIGSAY